MWRSATLGLTGWLQDTQKIWKSVSSSPSLTFREKKSIVQDSVTCLQCLQQCKYHAGTMVMMNSDLFVVLYDLLFGLSYDALQLVETFFHFSESHASWLLLTADSLQKFLGLFFCNARALLPLLDTLGQDLVDSTGKTKRHNCSESNLIHTTLYNCDVFPGLLGSELHAAVIRAVFGVGACSFDTSGSEALSGSSSFSDLWPLAVSHPVPVLLFGFVLPRLILLFLMNENKVLT